MVAIGHWRASRVGLMLVFLAAAGCGGSQAERPSFASLVQQAMKESNPEARGRRLVQLGFKQFQAQDLAGAQETLALAATACDQISIPAAQASVACMVADARAQIGDRQGAAAALAQATQAAEKIESSDARALRLCYIGAIQGAKLKDLAAAISSLQAAEQLADQLPSATAKVGVLAPIAEAYSAASLDEEAKRVCELARSAADSLDDPFQRSEAIAQVAVAQSRMSGIEGARSTFEQSRVAARQVEAPYSRTFAMANLAEKLIDVNETGMARELLADAAATVPQISEVDLKSEAKNRVDKLQAALPSLAGS